MFGEMIDRLPTQFDPKQYWHLPYSPLLQNDELVSKTCSSLLQTSHWCEQGEDISLI